MRVLRVLIARFRAHLSAEHNARAADADVREELESHLELETAEHVRRGLSPEAARRRAVMAAGGMTAAAEAVREQRRLPWAESLGADLRYALRTLRRNPGFTAVAAITLALGIGANTAIFSVVDGVILRPLPYPHADRLVEVLSTRKGQALSVSARDFLDWRSDTRQLSGFAAGASSSTILTGSGDALQLSQARVSANAFRVLQISPILGRAFLDGEDEQSAPRVALLSEGLWHRRFGSDSTIVGKTLLFDGFPTTIVGIAPAALRWPFAADVWMTTRFDEHDVSAAARGTRWLSVVARLSPAATLASARADMDDLARRSALLDPTHNAGIGARVTPLLDSIVGDVRAPLFLLLGAVAFVLLIACANVASLTLARLTARDAELAVRTALGAGRGRIARQILTESLVLSLVGGVAGVVLAAAGVRTLVALAPSDLPRLSEVHLDARVLGFTFALTLITGLTFGVAPALHAGVGDLHDRLRAAGRGALGQRAAVSSRRLLVVVEVALAIVLLSGAGLLLKSFALLRDVDPGFRTDGVVTFNVALPSDARYGTPDQSALFTTQLLNGIRQLPGVTSTATSFALPLTGDAVGFTFSIVGRAPAAADNEPRAEVRVVSPEYFAAMSMPVLRGRAFDASDRRDSRRTLIISAEVARRYFADEDPIGRSIETNWMKDGAKFGGEIIGVVGDVRQTALDRERTPHLYMSYAQRPLNEYDVVVRSTLPPAAVYAAVRSVLRRLDPQIPMNGARTLSAIVDASLGQRRFYLALLAVFAGVSMALAAVGIYGVIAYGVRQRRREIGIRLALGAPRGRVMAMVLSDGLKLVGLGTALGLVGAFALTRLLGTLLFHVGPRDPVTLLAAPAALAIVAAAACLIPARAASRQDPVEAIRAD